MKQLKYFFTPLLALLIVGHCMAGSNVGLTAITTTSPASPTGFCAGGAIGISFTIDATADAGNVFTAQLSDDAGSFANPVNIGSITSINAGTIFATIPLTAWGFGYRVRVVSSAPVVIGTDNGSDISVYSPPGQGDISSIGGTAVCSGGASIMLLGSTSNGYFLFNGTQVSGTFTNVLEVTTPGNYQWVPISLVGGCIGTPSPILTITTFSMTPTFSGLAGTYSVTDAPVMLTGSPASGIFSGPGISGDTFDPALAGVGGPYTITYTYTTGIIDPFEPIGCTFSTTQQVTVTQGCVPPNVIITPAGPITFCQGGSVLLNASSGGGLTFQWYVDGTLIPGANTSTFIASFSGSYTVVVTNASGCSATSSPVIVTVEPTVVASVSITSTPANAAICQNELMSFTATSVNGGPSNFIYTWKVNGVTVIPSGSSSFVPAGLADGDIVTCEMQSSLPCVANNPVTSNAIAVTIHPMPVAPTITASGPTTFCEGGAVLLSGNTGGVWHHNWVPVGTSPTLLATAAGVYTVIVINSFGCADSSTFINVQIIPLPTVSFSGLAGSYPVNAGAVTLTGSPAGGTFSGTGISGNTFNPATAGVGGPYNITYSYANGNGCTNTNTQQVTVTGAGCTVPAVPGSISTTAGSTLVCPGDVKTYMINPVAGATSYTWIAPAGADIIGGQGTTSVTVSYNAGFVTGDSLKVTANNTCGSSQPRGRKINRMSPPSSPLSINGPVSGICNSSAVPYSVDPVAGLTYDWSWNTTGVSIAGGQGTSNITSDFTTAFVTGKISVTASNSCGTSSPRNLIVNAKPATPGTITGSNAVCAGQQAVAYSVAPVTNATSYIWYAPTGAGITDGVTTSTGSSLATTSTNVQVNYSATSGAVRVKGINACAAGSTSTLPVSIVCRQGIEPESIAIKNDFVNEHSIFPNPTNGNFRILLANVKRSSTATIEIMNQFGQIVYQNNSTANNGMIDLKLAGKLSNGLYIVSCVVNGEKLVSKLLVNN